MVRWKLRNRSKPAQNTTGETDTAHVETREPSQPINNTTQLVTNEHEEIPVKEYNEVLYPQTAPPKRVSIPTEPRKEPMHRTSWENPSTIEHNVDTIGRKKTEIITLHSQTSDEVERKVDRLLAKKKLER